MKKQSWGSRIGLILAMSGNAVGFGNFLRFPIQVIKNGGGAFMVPYLTCFFLIGIPLLLMEWSMGRLGGKLGHHNTPFMMNALGKGKNLWKYVGALGLFSNIAIIAYYCYIESWTISYILESLKGTFFGKTQKEVADFFESYTTINFSENFFFSKSVIFYIICLLVNVYVISKGISGIEKVAKIAMPLLLLFAVILAVRGWTLGDSGANAANPDANALEGLNFLWNPDFSTIWSPKVWLSAAGQIFSTLSLGTGVIQCYASYVSSKQDIALGAVSAGFMNELIEVILASAIVIPISAGYLGLDWIKEKADFGMAFQTMPFLFGQWGEVLSSLGGLFWFGLLFFAGITSSVAFGMPWVNFLESEFKWKREKSAWIFGLVILIIGMPTVLFYKQGVLDEYDFWSGTISVFLLALFETILFVWVLGMDNGWRQINQGAEIKLPKILKFVCKYVTPYLLILLLLGSMFAPLGDDWGMAFKNLFSQGWTLDNSSLIKQLTQAPLKEKIAQAKTLFERENFEKSLLYSNLSRCMLLGLFLSICALVRYTVYKKERK